MFSELIGGTLDEYEHARQKETTATIFRYWYSGRAKDIAATLNRTAEPVVEASLGKGNFAEVPWIGYRFPELAPENFMSGIYVVYLFGTKQKKAALCLLQGVTNVSDRRRYLRYPSLKDYPELERRATALRARLQIPPRLRNFDLRLGAVGPRGKAYEKGYVCGITYERGALPSESALKKDFLCMMDLYAGITA